MDISDFEIYLKKKKASLKIWSLNWKNYKSRNHLTQEKWRNENAESIKFGKSIKISCGVGGDRLESKKKQIETYNEINAILPHVVRDWGENL